QSAGNPVPSGQQNLASAKVKSPDVVVLFNQGLRVLIAQAKVQGQVFGEFKVVVGISIPPGSSSVSSGSVILSAGNERRTQQVIRHRVTAELPGECKTPALLVRTNITELHTDDLAAQSDVVPTAGVSQIVNEVIVVV